MRQMPTAGAGLVAAVVVTAVAIGGCAFDPSTIPVPGTTTPGDTYTLHIEFANVLNLPPGAKVFANGVEVGDLDSVRIVDPASAGAPSGGFVVATVAITDAVRLPATTKAELRQATPLGDVHITLTAPPGDATAYLEPDATIPLAQTVQSAQVEDTLAGLATAVGGGAINDIQDTVRQLNSVLPADPGETNRIFGQIKTDLIDVGMNLETVDAVLDGLTANVDVALEDSDMLDQLLSDSGVDHDVAVISSLVKVLFLFTELGPVSHQLAWLGPLVGGLDASASAFVPMLLGSRPIDLSSPSNLRKLVDLVQYKIVPFVRSGPKVDVDGVHVAGSELSPADQTSRIIDTLRMVGAVR